MLKDKETVTTWANGFGTWYAKITFPWPYTTRTMVESLSRLRQKARRAIRKQLEQPGLVVRIDVFDEEINENLRTTSITFMER